MRTAARLSASRRCAATAYRAPTNASPAVRRPSPPASRHIRARQGDFTAAELLEAAGAQRIQPVTRGPSTPGNTNHEMGTARMGRSAATSVLNEWNQSWDVPNLFVTDGACMTSSGCQNPSLTYMALTARACHFAVEELKRRNI